VAKSYIVEEELPLKQGLKHFGTPFCRVMRAGVEEELPLKQGLKLICFLR